MGWWLPLDSQSPIQVPGKRPDLHVIYMQFHYGWQPPIPLAHSTAPSPSGLSHHTLHPEAPRAEWSWTRAALSPHLPRDLISPLCLMGNAQVGPEEDRPGVPAWSPSPTAERRRSNVLWIAGRGGAREGRGAGKGGNSGPSQGRKF